MVYELITEKKIQVLVAQHAVSHTSALIPSLKQGLVDSEWRIRQSSIHLLGDLLHLVMVSGRRAPKVTKTKKQSRHLI